jgi:hypothetical protein
MSDNCTLHEFHEVTPTPMRFHPTYIITYINWVWTMSTAIVPFVTLVFKYSRPSLSAEFFPQEYTVNTKTTNNKGPLFGIIHTFLVLSCHFKVLKPQITKGNVRE